LETTELVRGGRRRAVVLGRNIVSFAAVRMHGLTLAQVARGLRVSKQSVLRGVERGQEMLRELGWDVSDLVL
jgi:hypothetical protein